MRKKAKMGPKRFILFSFIIIGSTLLIVATQTNLILASSQGFFPRNGPEKLDDAPVSTTGWPGGGSIKDERNATEIGIMIASTSLARGSTEAIISHIDTKKLSRNEFVKFLQQDGSIANISSFLKSETQEIWVVTFLGSFSPDRIPFGIKAPVYSRIDVLIKGENGEVVGVHMSNWETQK
jgi:hypothetical protein